MAGFQVLSFNDVEPKLREYNRRRLHQKRKSGCLECKAKRVKCDEAKPTCARCKRNQRSCQYDRAGAGIIPASCISPHSAAALPVCTTGDGTPDQLVHYLEQNQFDILCMPPSEEVARLFHSSSAVRHAMLALAAGHLRYRTPGVLKHRVSQHQQQSIALTAYREVLRTPVVTLGQDGANHLLLSAILLNLLVFMLPEDSKEFGSQVAGSVCLPSSSWVFSSDPERLGWLTLQAGIRPLLLSMPQYREDSLSFLTCLLLGAERQLSQFKIQHDLRAVPAHWLRAFGYEIKSDGDCACDCDPHSAAGIYKQPLAVLAFLRSLQPGTKCLLYNISFLAKIHAHFRSLLFERDVKALWLFGYWLKIMCRHKDSWWSEKRAARDYEAVKTWLRMTKIAERDRQWKALIEELEEP